MTDPVARGLDLARARRWFEAHEAFEDAWRAEADPRRKATLRALVHACVALEHQRRGLTVGERLQLQKARARATETQQTPLTDIAPLGRAISAYGSDLAHPLNARATLAPS
ncbi:MAG: DUF309 domain-containing protein [Planctomycetota bacterium]|nr:DUF309 domain-containing protein [Planctomycetota bacterium]